MGTRTTIPVSKILRVLGAFVLIVLVVGTLWFALGGIRSMAIGLIVSLAYGGILGASQGLRHGFQHGLSIAVVGGLAVGLIPGSFGITAPERLTTPVLFSALDLAGVVLALNLAIALVRTNPDQPWALDWQEAVSIGVTNGALASGIVAFHALIIGGDVTSRLVATSAQDLLLYASIPIGAITAPVAEYLAFWLKPRFRVFVALLPYLRVIQVPLSGFAIGYLSLIFLFANFIGAEWRADPSGAYLGLPAHPPFGSFFYLSVETITGIGFADSAPHSAYAKALASIEVILGVMWNTVFVATFIAYLQPRFQQLTKGPEEQ